jgi:hypothetical protein
MFLADEQHFKGSNRPEWDHPQERKGSHPPVGRRLACEFQVGSHRKHELGCLRWMNCDSCSIPYRLYRLPPGKWGESRPRLHPGYESMDVANRRPGRATKKNSSQGRRKITAGAEAQRHFRRLRGRISKPAAWAEHVPSAC